jgi:DNA-binding response OmpR family regulator
MSRQLDRVPDLGVRTRQVGCRVTQLADIRRVIALSPRRYSHAQFQDRESRSAVMLDIKLPNLNGLEVLQRIKSDPHLHTIPVAMLTSSREELDRAKSYELGVNGYVVKPADFEQFAAAIKQNGQVLGYSQRTTAGNSQQDEMTNGACSL